jgi:glutamyl-tRNA reductase
MLYVTGLNHHQAEVSLREKLAIAERDVPQWIERFRAMPGVEEVVVLSTCNRTEIYAAGAACEQVAEAWKSQAAIDDETMAKLYHHRDDQAVRHLLRVVSGLDSMVLGETEIAGQVKDAYALAQTHGATQRRLNKLFQHAFRVSKSIRSTTRIQQGATSVGGAAVELAEHIFGDLKQSTVMLLGAGEISRRTAQSLQSRGAKSLIVSNRTYERAQSLAEEIGGRAIKYDDWPEEIRLVDVVISSTAAPHHIITPDQIRAVLRRRHGRPLFLIDVAMPRDIDPACDEIDGVYLYNLDHLEHLAATARQQREREIQTCEKIIETEVGLITPPLISP